VLLGLLAVAGVGISLGRLAFHMADEEVPVMAYVRQHRKPGEVYFLPVNVPKLKETVYGSLSSDFKPLPDKRQSKQVIPVDLQRFRLHADAPIFVDFKAIPYKDVEVLAWKQRIDVAVDVGKQLRQGQLRQAMAELRKWGVTHIVQPAGQKLTGEGLVAVHEDPYYRVYQLPTPARKTP
jgi:hypothetical protein